MSTDVMPCGCQGHADNAELCRYPALLAALERINTIRNSIVSLQAINWSEHIYPLVAALNDAGIEGKPYPADRAYLGSLIDQCNEARAERDRYRAALEKAFTALSSGQPCICHRDSSDSACPSCDESIEARDIAREALAGGAP